MSPGRMLCVVLLNAASAFLPAQHRVIAPPQRVLSSAPLVVQHALPVAIVEPLEAYANIWIPLFKSYKDLVPEFLLHWGHGAAMGTVLCSMGLIGAWMGWQIRGGNGGEVNALTVGERSGRRTRKLWEAHSSSSSSVAKVVSCSTRSKATPS